MSSMIAPLIGDSINNLNAHHMVDLSNFLSRDYRTRLFSYRATDVPNGQPIVPTNT